MELRYKLYQDNQIFGTQLSICTFPFVCNKTFIEMTIFVMHNCKPNETILNVIRELELHVELEVLTIFANSTAILTTTLSLGYSLKCLVGYSLWVHLRIPSIIIFFEVPRIASQYRTMLLETNCICEDFATTEGDDKHDQNLVLVKRNHNGNSGKTTMFIFFSSHVVFKLLHDYLILSSLELTHIWFRFGHKSRLVYCPKIQQWAMMCYKDSYLGPGGCTQC